MSKGGRCYSGRGVQTLMCFRASTRSSPFFAHEVSKQKTCRHLRSGFTGKAAATRLLLGVFSTSRAGWESSGGGATGTGLGRQRRAGWADRQVLANARGFPRCICLPVKEDFMRGPARITSHSLTRLGDNEASVTNEDGAIRDIQN